MKKLVLFAAAIVALSFASCSNKANTEAAPETDTTAVVAEEAPEVVAPVEGDSVATPVVEEAPAAEAAPAQ
ncbi:hypothetical protein M2132_001619 [Dysgonomonas sp. PH5-45]|uniref:hypothetical protein n=1 Tax=unclassified Dysgonomonas TaxID=2630389 RepID=UPI00247337BF|nr:MULTISPECIES: hypothetical protein [unclassified Dysgonomonas]MDH6355280.1 hypothetical protein [Dysgonomonas sp. PH5-45]MDH6388194.1 hypothetical protein [Dysgonomonas sp. PH5-37]